MLKPRGLGRCYQLRFAPDMPDGLITLQLRRRSALRVARTFRFSPLDPVVLALLRPLGFGGHASDSDACPGWDWFRWRGSPADSTLRVAPSPLRSVKPTSGFSSRPSNRLASPI